MALLEIEKITKRFGTNTVLDDVSLEVDAGDFAKAVDRVATVSSERSRAVKLALDEDRLVLSVNAPDAGAADERAFFTHGILDFTEQRFRFVISQGRAFPGGTGEQDAVGTVFDQMNGKFLGFFVINSTVFAKRRDHCSDNFAKAHNIHLID